MERLFTKDIGKPIFELQEELGYTYKTRMAVMVEARPQKGQRTTLFTKEAFEEMIKLNDFILNITAPQELVDQIKPESVIFTDLCQKVNVTDEIVENFAAENCPTDERFCLPPIPEKCKVSDGPLMFIYDRKTDKFDLDQFDDNMDLIARIQTGKGDSTFMYYGHKNLYVELIFASTTPREVTQDYVEGNNDLFAAKSARWVYHIDNKDMAEGYDRPWSQKYEMYLQATISEWGD